MKKNCTVLDFLSDSQEPHHSLTVVRNRACAGALVTEIMRKSLLFLCLEGFSAKYVSVGFFNLRIVTLLCI